MTREDKEIFERLGREGLGRVLLDVLDHRRLVRLANACGLEYPGMRAQSQKRERLASDLVQKGFDDEATMLAISRTLRKETAEAGRRWNQLTSQQKAERIGDERFLLRKGNLGLHLYFLASSDGEAGEDGFESLLARQHLMRIAADDQGAKDGAEAPPPREQLRLEKRLAELNRKNQHLEAQAAKAREAERAFKRDLIQRKGELAEARMLAERLRRELAEAKEEAARRAAVEAPTIPAMQEALDRLDKAARKLGADQKRLTHQLEKLVDPEGRQARADLPVKIDPAPLEPLGTALEALRRDLATLKRERKADTQQLSSQVENLRAQLQQLQESAASRARSPLRRPRAKGEPERVGVFIDVQNMYYGARQLKGKLDFDALQQAAVRERRLIQAVAYVVESKEIDQSGFIKLLEQRAIAVRRKTLQVRADGSMKGDWDMELALDILDAAPNLDVVVLVSGDGDFTSLVQRVKAMGPRVEVIGFPRATAKSLVGAADHFQPLDRKFMIYPRRRRGGPEAVDEPARPAAEAQRSA